MPGKSDVVVIGAGAVGACCASFLQRLGKQVTLIDRLPPGEACSFGNAGSLSSSSCVPIAVPGLLREVPGWLLSKDGPLTIRWRYLPALTPWLWRFVKAGNDEQLRTAAPALSSLHRPSFELHQDLAKHAKVADLVRSSDYLHLYSSLAKYEAARYEHELRRRHGGAEIQILDGDELRELEPDLSPHYVRAARIRHQGYAANPGRLVKAYVQHVVDNGGELIEGEVTGFDVRDNRVVAVDTGGRRLETAEVVIAAGAWSARLCAMLDLAVPLETERGYHVTVADAGLSIKGTIMEGDGKFVATPMEMGVRFAGTVELASVDAPPDYARADVILRRARRMFPRLREGPASRWMGCRPSLPDGLPVIGPSPRQENVYLAFGHAHTGMIGSPQTGRIIAGMIARQPLNIDVSPFRVERFG